MYVLWPYLSPHCLRHACECMRSNRNILRTTLDFMSCYLRRVIEGGTDPTQLLLTMKLGLLHVVTWWALWICEKSNVHPRCVVTWLSLVYGVLWLQLILLGPFIFEFRNSRLLGYARSDAVSGHLDHYELTFDPFQWRAEEFCWRGGGQQIQLRAEGRENGDLGAVAPYSGVPLNLQMSETRILIR
jgi:hypothetical protein